MKGKLSNFLVVGLIIFFFGHNVFALEASSSKVAELNRLNQVIQNLKGTLSSNQGKKSEINQQLQKVQKNVQQISAQLEKLNQDIARQEKLLKDLQTKQGASEKNLIYQKKLLAEQFRKAYASSRYPIPLITVGGERDSIARMIVYQNYLSKARIKGMNDLRLSLQQLMNNQRRLNKERESLQKKLQDQQQQQVALKIAQQNKQELLNQINLKIQNQNIQLSQLIANKQALENLIKKLRAQAAKQAALEAAAAKRAAKAAGKKGLVAQQKLDSQNMLPLEKLHWNLSWPTKGPLLKRYGTQIDTSGLKYNGVLIGAPKGQPVQAVYPGRIVFANWLQGFGKLIIIDHGKGLMTLYGRNSALYKKTGDAVQSGEVIAGVGNNSGQEQMGLYFEVRQNGRPVNPERWCK